MLRLFLLRALLVGFVCQVNKPDSWEYNFDNTVIQNEMTKYGLSGAGIEQRRSRDRKNHQKRKSWQESLQTARETTMKTGDSLNITTLVRSQKTGVLLPRQGTFVREIENLGRKLILVDFGSAGKEYLFPNEIAAETHNG
jgi:hypothetical protein